MFFPRPPYPVLPRSRAGRRRLTLLVLLAVFMTDVASKSWALAVAGTGVGFGAGGFVELALAKNEGLAFSTGTGTLTWTQILAIRLAVLSALVLVALRFALERLRFALGFGLVLGGGLGNAWDGAGGDGGVVDFISTGPITPLEGGVVLNLADLWILTGLALLYPLFRVAGRVTQRRFQAVEARVLGRGRPPGSPSRSARPERRRSPPARNPPGRSTRSG